jgi:hypothetical protein
MQAPLTDLKHCSLWAPRPALPACQSRTGLGSVPGRWGRPEDSRTRHLHSRWVQQHPAAAAGSALGSADLPPEQPDAFIDGVDVFPRLKERDVYKCAPCTLSTLSLSQGAVTLGAECRPFASADRCCGFPQAVGSQQGSIFRGGAGRSQLFVRGAQRLTSALRVRYRLANTVTVDWPLDRALRSALGRPDIPGARGEQGVHRAGL